MAAFDQVLLQGNEGIDVFQEGIASVKRHSETLGKRLETVFESKMASVESSVIEAVSSVGVATHDAVVTARQDILGSSRDLQDHIDARLDDADEQRSDLDLGQAALHKQLKEADKKVDTLLAELRTVGDSIAGNTDKIYATKRLVEDIRKEAQDIQRHSGSFYDRFADGAQGFDADGNGIVSPSEALRFVIDVVPVDTARAGPGAEQILLLSQENIHAGESRLSVAYLETTLKRNDYFSARQLFRIVGGAEAFDDDKDGYVGPDEIIKVFQRESLFLDTAFTETYIDIRESLALSGQAVTAKVVALKRKHALQAGGAGSLGAAVREVMEQFESQLDSTVTGAAGFLEEVVEAVGESETKLLEALRGVTSLTWAGLKEKAGAVVTGAWKGLLDTAMGRFGLGRLRSLAARLAGAFQVAKQVWNALQSAFDCAVNIITAITTFGTSWLAAGQSCLQAYDHVRHAIRAVEQFALDEIPAIVEEVKRGTEAAKMWIGSLGQGTTPVPKRRRGDATCTTGNPSACPTEVEHVISMAQESPDAPVSAAVSLEDRSTYVANAIGYIASQYYWNPTSISPFTREELLHGGVLPDNLRQLTAAEAREYAGLNDEAMALQMQLEKVKAQRSLLVHGDQLERQVKAQLHAGTNSTASIDVEQVVLLGEHFESSRWMTVLLRVLETLSKLSQLCRADPTITCPDVLDLLGDSFKGITASRLRAYFNDFAYGAQAESTGTVWSKDVSAVVEISRSDYPWEFQKMGYPIAEDAPDGNRYLTFSLSPPSHSRVVGARLKSLAARLLFPRGQEPANGKLLTMHVRKGVTSEFVELDGKTISSFVHDYAPFASTYNTRTCESHGTPSVNTRLLGIYGQYSLDLRSIQVELGDDWTMLSSVMSIELVVGMDFAVLAHKEATPLFDGAAPGFPHLMLSEGHVCRSPSWLPECAETTCSQSGLQLRVAAGANGFQCMSRDCWSDTSLAVCCEDRAVPMSDPCEDVVCSAACENRIVQQGGGTYQLHCGWDSEENRCAMNKTTTASEKALLLESKPGGCDGFNKSWVNTTDTTVKGSSDRDTAGSTAGIVIGSLLGVVLIAAVLVMLVRRMHLAPKTTPEGNHQNHQTTYPVHSTDSEVTASNV